MSTIDRIHTAAARLRFALLAILASVWIGGGAQGATTSTDEITVVATIPSVVENSTGAAKFTISRNGGITGDLTVFYDAPGNSLSAATSGVDYQALPGFAVIPDGQSSVDVLVHPIDDALFEGSETVLLSILNGPGYIVGSPFVAKVTILDDELRATTRVPVVVTHEITGQVGLLDSNPFNAAIIRAEFNSVLTTRRDITVEFEGTATADADYELSYMIGHDLPVGSGSGQLLDAARRALASVVVNGIPLAPPATDPKGYATGATSIEVLNSFSRIGAGVFEVGDIISFNGLSKLYTITSVAAGSTPGTTAIGVSPPLEATLQNQTDVQTAISVGLTNLRRLTVTIPAGYRHVEYEIYTKSDDIPEGGETVVFSLVENPDYLTQDPTVATAYIADSDLEGRIALISNAVEGGTNGVIRVSISAPLTKDIQVPFAVTGGTAIAGVDYSMTGLENATLFGSVTIPAGSTSADITVIAAADAIAETVETVTVSMLESVDYVLVSTSGSSSNPSATMNIADSTTPITITPTPPASGSTGTAPTTPVRTLPTSSNGKGCGIGSGSVGLVVLAVTLLRLSLRRQRRA